MKPLIAFCLMALLSTACFSPYMALMGVEPSRPASDEVLSAPAAPADDCHVTLSNGIHPDVPNYEDLDLGNENRTLFTIPWPDGTVIFEPGGPGEVAADGTLTMKFPWYRAATGPLTIEGRRLDGDVPPLSAHIPDGYGDTGFQATGIIFPTTGCWEVTGRVGDESLTFVTRVVLIE